MGITERLHKVHVKNIIEEFLSWLNRVKIMMKQTYTKPPKILNGENLLFDCQKGYNGQ